MEISELPLELCGRAGTVEHVPHPLYNGGEADRIEPDVRVMLLVITGGAAAQLEPGQYIDCVALRPCDRILERGLEATAEIENDVGGPNPLGRARSQLEIVRLDARRCEVLDVDGRAADPLGGERQWVERRDYACLAVRRL
jgi:hypothetical protein